MKFRWLGIASVLFLVGANVASAAESASRAHVDPETHQLVQPLAAKAGSAIPMKRMPLGAFQLRPDGTGVYYPSKVQGLRATLSPLRPLQVDETEEKR